MGPSEGGLRQGLAAGRMVGPQAFCVRRSYGRKADKTQIDVITKPILQKSD